ncbi:response regulator [Frischella perrara]|jgi:Response regulators consisting of a CheY-like receiver domain and a winged-helix DNA-binding domain|uniref:Two-component system response regulator BasR n=1 Tax=Frischella perrara TaxID=1267021 RepID=A0A318MP25_FRIPE|nr:response regulator [Frischella perrara]MCT6875674.1 response regulator [Frischella perrara]PXY94560.1 two-component system response regulator BasR [Frischella perrara]
MKILITEDDPLLLKGLYSALSAEGFVCEMADTAKLAKQLMQSYSFSVAILDLGLPDSDGLQLLRTWRQQNNDIPVLILTARDTIEDRVEGLDLGADDYLIKPFALQELLARVRALIRRREGICLNIINYGQFKVDLKQQLAFDNNIPLNLTPKEFALLARLITKPEQQIHRDILQNDLYNWNNDPNSNVLEVHIHGLRQKIGKRFIQTVRGYGYRLTLN